MCRGMRDYSTAGVAPVARRFYAASEFRRRLLPPQMTRHDWQKHYQPAWGRVVSAKEDYDPDGILTPGQGIF